LALPRRGGARCRGRRGGRVVVRGRLSLVPVAVDVWCGEGVYRVEWPGGWLLFGVAALLVAVPVLGVVAWVFYLVLVLRVWLFVKGVLSSL